MGNETAIKSKYIIFLNVVKTLKIKYFQSATFCYKRASTRYDFAGFVF